MNQVPVGHGYTRADGRARAFNAARTAARVAAEIDALWGAQASAVAAHEQPEPAE
jgi:hypothetical protein